MKGSMIAEDRRMIAITVGDVKRMMKCLLLQEDFDNFYLTEAAITTFVTYTIDGQLPGKNIRIREAALFARPLYSLNSSSSKSISGKSGSEIGVRRRGS